jgi:hypothetical protein
VNPSAVSAKCGSDEYDVGAHFEAVSAKCCDITSALSIKGDRGVSVKMIFKLLTAAGFESKSSTQYRDVRHLVDHAFECIKQAVEDGTSAPDLNDLTSPASVAAIDLFRAKMSVAGPLYEERVLKACTGLSFGPVDGKKSKDDTDVAVERAAWLHRPKYQRSLVSWMDDSRLPVGVVTADLIAVPVRLDTLHTIVSIDVCNSMEKLPELFVPASPTEMNSRLVHFTVPAGLSKGDKHAAKGHSAWDVTWSMGSVLSVVKAIYEVNQVIDSHFVFVIFVAPSLASELTAELKRLPFISDAFERIWLKTGCTGVAKEGFIEDTETMVGYILVTVCSNNKVQ